MAKMVWKTDDEIKAEEVISRLNAEADEQEAERQRVITEFVAMQAEQWLLDADIPEDEKNRFKAIFQPFKVGASYAVGDKVNFRGDVYEVIQAHTAQADWLPADVPALFKPYLQSETEDGTDIIHAWVQPLGQHDAYPADAKVTHKGQIWQSSVANNVWEPAFYGWELLGDE